MPVLALIPFQILLHWFSADAHVLAVIKGYMIREAKDFSLRVKPGTIAIAGHSKGFEANAVDRLGNVERS